MIGSTLKVLVAAALLGTATSRRVTLNEVNALEADEISSGMARSKHDYWPGAVAAGQVGEVLQLPPAVLKSPECAQAGVAEAEGYMLFTENKDTDDRNFNSADVGFLPGRLQGPVRIDLESTGFLEIRDLARNHRYLSWVGRKVEEFEESLGQKEPTMNLTSWEGGTSVVIGPSLPSTLLLRVVIYTSKSTRASMTEDGVPWKVRVSWAGASMPCKQPHMTGLKVPLSEMAAMHTLKYMQFMPGYEAVVRRGRDITMQLPAPSVQELQGINSLMMYQCSATAALPSFVNDSFTCRPGKLGHACKYSEEAGLCVSARTYEGLPLVHLKMASGKDVPLQVTMKETAYEKADSICKLWNATVEEREDVIKKLMGFVPDEAQDSALACDRFLGELAMASSQGTETCKLQETGECQAVAAEGSIIQVSVKIPATAEVGRAALFVTDILGTGLPTFVGALAVICNPWSEEDQTYLTADMLRNASHDSMTNKRLGWMQGYDDDEARHDYVLKSSTHIFKGALGNGASDMFGDPWEYHQFRSLYHVLHLLDLLEPSMRGDLVKVARKIPHLINSYVLAGNWGEIKDGESPSYWSSSADVLGRAHRMSPLAEVGFTSLVRWGQCFVFGGVLGASLRSLGIPARTITNFGSAHDRQVGHPVAQFDWIIQKSDGDSVWNFHVWNEAWFARPDLPEVDRKAQWNVLDATPQEESDGLMQMGPAAMSVIRRGADDTGVERCKREAGEGENAKMNYDVAFAIGEVNSVQVLQTGEDNDELVGELWAEEGYDGLKCKDICPIFLTPPERIRADFPFHLKDKTKALCADSCVPWEEKLLDFHSVGQYMSTEGPRCKDATALSGTVMGWDDCREDVTANYKSKPCPTDKFCKIMEEQAEKVKDLRTDSRTYLTVSPKRPEIGDIIEVDLWQEQPVPVWLQVKVVAMSYTGKPVAGMSPLVQFAGPWKSVNKKLKIEPKDYVSMLKTTQYIQIIAVAWPDLSATSDIDIKGASFYAKKIVALQPSTLELAVLTVGPAPEFKLKEASQRFVNDSVAVRLRWRNPFPVPLVDCAMGVVTPATDVWVQPAPAIAPHTVLELVSERDLLLEEVGPIELMAILQCPGLPTTKERISFLVEEPIVSAESTTTGPSSAEASTSTDNTSNVTNVTEGSNLSDTVNTSANTSADKNVTDNTTFEVSNLSETVNTSVNKSPEAVIPATGAEKFPTAPPKCRVGEHVPCCPDGTCLTRCAGDQCCPGRPIGLSGSFTCPSASKSYNKCTHHKITDCTR